MLSHVLFNDFFYQKLCVLLLSLSNNFLKKVIALK